MAMRAADKTATGNCGRNAAGRLDTGCRIVPFRAQTLVRDRYRHLQAIDPFGKPSGGLCKRTCKPADFRSAAAGQQREQRAIGIDTQCGTGGGPVDFERNFVGEWMADEFRVDAVLTIKVGFERQHAQHLVDRCLDAVDARLPPGPHLRTDILNRLDAGRAQPRGERQIEIRRIDAAEQVRWIGQQARGELPPQLQQARQVSEHLGQPHDRQLLGAIPGIAAGGPHFRPGDTNETHARCTGLERLNQAGPQRIAGRLAGGDRDAH
jgi:hypothetical protein